MKAVISPDRQLLVSAEEAAALCGVSRSTWLSWDANGLCPRRICIGGSVRWSRLQLNRWAAIGAPDRAAFEKALPAGTLEQKKVDLESRMFLTADDESARMQV